MLREAITHLPVYQPGKPIEIVSREFGLDPEIISKLASNENPLGASPKALDAAHKALLDIWLYPENSSYFLRQKLADRLDADLSEIVIGAGSNELFYLLGDLFLQPGSEVVMGKHAFITYKIVTLLYGAKAVEVPLQNYTHDLDAMRHAITDNTKLVFLPCPNNPTGTANTPKEVFSFARDLPEHVIFVLDDAYGEYRREPLDMLPLIREGRKILWSRTFSKIYGLAGLRIGYGVMPAELAELLNRVRPPFNVCNVSQAAALAALDDDSFVQRSLEINQAGMQQLSQGLEALGLDPVQSQGNFILVKVPHAQNLFLELQKKGIIVRPMDIYELPDHLRGSVGLEPDNQRFLDELAKLLESVQTGKTVHN